MLRHPSRSSEMVVRIGFRTAALAAAACTHYGFNDSLRVRIWFPACARQTVAMHMTSVGGRKRIYSRGRRRVCSNYSHWRVISTDVRSRMANCMVRLDDC